MSNPQATLRSASRVLVAELDRALSELRRPISDVRVHAVRKELKRVRAVLRLLREPLGEPAYRRNNVKVRDVAHHLAPVRDAKVMLDMFQNELRDCGISADQEAAKSTLDMLRREHGAMWQRLRAPTLSANTRSLRELRSCIDNMPDTTLNSSDLVGSIRRAYRSARKSFRDAQRQPLDDRLHEWRKRQNCLFNQIDVALPVKPKRAAKFLRHVHRLAERLGDDHDLALLHTRVVDRPGMTLGEHEASTFHLLSAHINQRRAMLQHQSFALAKYLYSEKTDHFARRAKKWLTG